MTLALLISLLAVGFILIAVELFVTPGFIVGIIGMVFLGSGIWLGFDQYGEAVGFGILAFVSIVLVSGVVFTLRSGFWRRIALQDQITGKANTSNEQDVNPGMKGVTLSALRPTGSALIEGKRYEVVTDGEFIDSNREIVVSHLAGYKIFVKQINQ